MPRLVSERSVRSDGASSPSKTANPIFLRPTRRFVASANGTESDAEETGALKPMVGDIFVAIYRSAPCQLAAGHSSPFSALRSIRLLVCRSARGDHKL